MKPLGISSDTLPKFMREVTLLLLPNFAFLLVRRMNGFKTVQLSQGKKLMQPFRVSLFIGKDICTKCVLSICSLMCVLHAFSIASQQNVLPEALCFSLMKMNHVTFSAEHKKEYFRNQDKYFISSTLRVNHEDLWVRFGVSHSTSAHLV